MKIRIFFILFLFLAVLIGTSPYILSRNIFHPYVEFFFKKKGIDFEKASFSWTGPQQFYDISLSKEDAQLKIKHLSKDVNFLKLLIKPMQGITKITQASLYIKNQPYLQDINGSFEYINKKISNINIHGKNQDGDFSIFLKETKNFYQGECNLKNFPIQTIENLFPKYPFSKIFGQTIDLQAILKDQESIHIHLNSFNCFANINLKYFQNTLFLNEDASIRIKITEDLSKYLINPLFISAIHAENPLKIILHKKDFSFPLDIDTKKIQMSATLDIGKFTATAKGSLGIIIGILKYNYFTHVSDINVWCTPWDVQIKNGILHTSRLDALLLDKIHICTFGDINLINKDISMILGITASALKESFGIKNLQKNYILEIPIYGKIDHIKIDTAQAAAKIAALKAMQSHKTIFSKIFEIFKPLKKDSKIPPAKKPFPWEK